jgi:hypothetical protein
MVTEIYSHILDEGRQHNASLIEEAFYKKENGKENSRLKEEEQEPNNNPDLREKYAHDKEKKHVIDTAGGNTSQSQESNAFGGNAPQSQESRPENTGNDLAALMKLLQKPELASVLKSLANAI